MRGQNHWEALRRVIENTQRFLLTSHVLPEGDAIGSEVALALHLKSLGKQVVVLNDSPALQRYEFLTRLHPVLSWKDPGAWPDPGWVQTTICLDASNWDYLGSIGRWLRTARTRLVSIDHHHVKEPFGDLDVVCEDAAATGEVLYRYFQATGAQIDRDIAEALYASILFDTWGFRLPNATNATVQVAGELLRYGVDHRAACRNLFEIDSLPRLNLLRLALGTLRCECNGRLAWLTIPEDLFLATGATFVDGDGILDHLLGLQDVEVCVMFRQQDKRGVKATFRSKGGHDVGRIAEEMGGGGRETAAGVLLPMQIHEAIDQVLPKVHHLLCSSTGCTCEEASLLEALRLSRVSG